MEEIDPDRKQAVFCNNDLMRETTWDVRVVCTRKSRHPAYNREPGCFAHEKNGSLLFARPDWRTSDSGNLVGLDPLKGSAVFNPTACTAKAHSR